MSKLVSYNSFIKKVIFITTIVIATLFIFYGFFVQSKSIKENLKNESSLFVDLIFENLYTSMKNGATGDDLDNIITNIESRITNSHITIHKKKSDTAQESIKAIFNNKESNFYVYPTHIDFARPIVYENRCISCHSTKTEGDIAAVIQLEFSILDLNISLKDILVLITFLFISSIIVIFIIWYIYLKKIFIFPIQNLVKQMLNINEHKDLKKEIKIDTSIEEIHQLETVFNQQNKKISGAYDELEKASNLDTLTGVYNRRKFDEAIVQEINRAQRYKYKLCIVSIDLNKFKLINDTYGHDAGDKVLIEFSQTILNNIRKIDMFFRVGGDEFMLILSHTDYKNSLSMIEKLQNVLKKRTVKLESDEITISASFGSAEYGSDAEDLSSLIKAADNKMYKNKHSKH